MRPHDRIGPAFHGTGPRMPTACGIAIDARTATRRAPGLYWNCPRLPAHGESAHQAVVRIALAQQAFAALGAEAELEVHGATRCSIPKL